MQVGDLVKIDESTSPHYGKVGLIILCDWGVDGSLYSAKVLSGGKRFWIRGHHLWAVNNEAR